MTPPLPNVDVGIHYGMPASDYHADPVVQPSLSRSLAWTLAQRAPIHGWLEHPRLNPDVIAKKVTPVMEFGGLGHELLLNQESTVEIGAYKDFKTDAARQWRDECHAAGKIPALKKTFERACELRDCALAHIERTGFAEEFYKAKDEVTVVSKFEKKTYIRARFDKLLIDPDGAKNRQRSEIAVSFDLKITQDANPIKCAKLIGDKGYDLQKKFYHEALNGIDKKYRGRQRMIFFFIESTFPHCVTPIEISRIFDVISGRRFDRAMKVWRECMKTGSWPTFAAGEGTFTVEPPRYIEMQELEDEDPAKLIENES